MTVKVTLYSKKSFYKLSDVPTDALEIKSGAEFLANIEGGRGWINNPSAVCPATGRLLGRFPDDVWSMSSSKMSLEDKEGLEQSLDKLLSDPACRIWISKESDGGNV